MKALYFPRAENTSNPWYLPKWVWDRMSQANRDRFIYNRRKHQSCLVLMTENAPVVRPKFRVRVQRNGTLSVVGYAQSEKELSELMSLYAPQSPNIQWFDPDTSRWTVAAGKTEKL